MADQQNQAPKPKRDTILPERLMRRVLEGVGDVVDRKLGRTAEPGTALADAELHSRLVWSHRGVGSWYKNKRGRVFATSPWRLVDYWEMTRKLELGDYVFKS